MKATLVSIAPATAAEAFNRPALTPQLLASTGARYSRSKEGLEEILSKIDPQNPDKSAQSIFRYVDYGHQSIADMAPVPIFIDGLSILSAYYIFANSPKGDGQETSTRYADFEAQGLIDDSFVNTPALETWKTYMLSCIEMYKEASDIWAKIAYSKTDAEMGIPEDVPQSTKDRMTRNFVFDRARYFIPAAMKTNMMIILSARQWAMLLRKMDTQNYELRHLANLIRFELSLVVPDLMKHMKAQEYDIQAAKEEWKLRFMGAKEEPAFNMLSSYSLFESDGAYFDVFGRIPPPSQIIGAMKNHDNRYAPIGPALKRIPVRFGWNRIAFAELRDLNRHRTGEKYTPLIPVGFYGAVEEAIRLVPADKTHYIERLSELASQAYEVVSLSREIMNHGNRFYEDYLLLGTEVAFEHTTTLNHAIYEIELRTGKGSHYRYAKHVANVAEKLYEQIPELRKTVIQGNAEPE